MNTNQTGHDRLKNKLRTWYYRLRKSVEFVELLDSTYQAWRHKIGNRVGNYDILWTQALSVASLEELQELEAIRDEMRKEK